MRITNSMMTTNLLLNVNRNLTKMSKKQDELATGKRIHVPSDDPVLASKILARRTDLAELEQYGKNANDALGWMEVTEKAIEDNGNIFQKIRELTVQAANGTNTADDTQKIKLEIENMKEQLIANGNSTFAGRYIFSGFETDKKLLADDGSYNIDVDQYSFTNKPVVKYEVGVGESIDVMTSGLDIYGTVATTNIMTSTFPNGNNSGIASKREFISADFDLDIDYSAPLQNLDITMGGNVYTVDETLLDGSISDPISKEELLNAFKSALGGSGTLGDDANIYFNANDELVIESNAFGPTIMSDASALFTVSAGNIATEATLSSPAFAYTDPLSSDEITALNDNALKITVNGITKKVKPQAPFTNMTTYVAEMNTRLDVAFGSDVIDMTLGLGGEITFDTKNTSDSVVPNLEVDFPVAHTSSLIDDVDELLGYLEVADHENLSAMLEKIDLHMDRVLSLRADVGARTNRMELVTKRIASNNVSFTKLLSDAEDADMSEVIMELKNAENVYKASLSTGARVIQPSLIDFLR